MYIRKATHTNTRHTNCMLMLPVHSKQPKEAFFLHPSHITRHTSCILMLPVHSKQPK